MDFEKLKIISDIRNKELKRLADKFNLDFKHIYDLYFEISSELSKDYSTEQIINIIESKLLGDNVNLKDFTDDEDNKIGSLIKHMLDDTRK